MAVKASGSIALVRIDDGEKGERGPGIYKVTTAPSSFTTTTGGFTPTYRIALSTVKTQSKVTEVLVGDVLQYSYYQYPVGYVDSSYVYCGARTSIRGATGATGATGSAGADGADGADGIGISAIVTQYYLSTSSSSQSGGSWSTTQATWVTGRYYWTREAITWTDGSTTYTTAVLATGLNTAMQDAYDADLAIASWCYNNNRAYINGAKIYAGSITALGNVTAGSFNLGNGKFVVDSNGYLTATGASIYGNMFIDSTSTVTFSYTSTDLTTIQNIIMGTTSSTDAYVQKYDVNGDGYISSSDYNLVQKIINAGNSITTSFILNPTFDTTNYSDGVLNVSVDGFHTTRISSLGALYSTYASFDEVNIGELQADNYLDAYSISEQWTGQYWIDGTKIYTKTYYVAISSQPSNYTISISDLGYTDVWIDMQNSFALMGSSYGTSVPVFYVSSSGWWGLYTNLEPVNKKIVINANSNTYPLKMYITLRYTK